MSEAEDAAFREMFPLVLGALAGLALLFLVAALIIADGDDTYVPPGMSRAEVVAERVRPIGEVNMGGPMVAESTTASADAASAEPRSGEAVYTSVCSACHDNGTLGAPVFGNESAWAERAQKGLQTLVDHSLNGFNQMPPQSASASETEIERAVQYMLDEAGVQP
ncbi:MAG: c-type cytochrome [Halofilum sp. (in: g-proteobacteria)]|nr:c-type cytochrome [Halofilum sp. (in: g-proteobacteria)]